MKINELKNFIRTTIKQHLVENDQNLDELARIAGLIKLGDEAKVKEAKEKFKNTWIEKIITYLEKEKPEGATKIELAQASGKPRQQDVNPIINKLIEAGILIKGDLVHPPKEKNKNNSGIKGRPLIPAEERKGEEVVKSIIKKLKFEEEPRPEYKSFFIEKHSQEDYDKLVSLVDAYMGRKVNSSREEKSKLQEDLRQFLISLGYDVKKPGRTANPALASLNNPPPPNS